MEHDTVCPYCEHDCQIMVHANPKCGDIYGCCVCDMPSIYNKRLRLRAPHPDEMMEIYQKPRFQEYLVQVIQANKEATRH